MFRKPKRRSPREWMPCPHCGAEIPASARFCQACGASDDSGWNDDTEGFWEGGYDEDDDDFDYDEFVRREYPEHADGASRVFTKPMLYTAIILLLCLAFVLSAIGWGFGHTTPTTGSVRFATFNVALNRPTAGKLAEQLAAGQGVKFARLAQIIQTVRPDVLLLNEIDYDDEQRSAELFHDRYLAVPHEGTQPITYPHRYVAEVNTGVPSGQDLDHDGKSDGPGDALGYGAFPGQYGMAVFSKYPIDASQVRTFRKFLWQDMPDRETPRAPGKAQEYYSEAALSAFRLSSKSHWDVPIQTPGGIVHFLVCHPTPPVFDGEEDRNGCRNHDEIRLWADYVTPGRAAYLIDDTGRHGGLQDGARFVIAGDMNADPHDGDSRNRAILQLTEHPLIQGDLVPTSDGGAIAAEQQGRANTGHAGDPAADTADFPDRSTGNLRADYVLVSRNLPAVSSGVFWPPPTDRSYAWVTASDHRLVWVDVQP